VGNFTVQVNPHWAPVGARRFRRLLEEHVYDQARFFRVLTGFVAQFGIPGDPKLAAYWSHKTLADDIVKVTNKRGRISFAMSGIDTRTTQVFINLGDNRVLDKPGFAPFAEVVSGMETVDLLYAGYGEGAPRGKGPDQSRVQRLGNAFLAEKFPLLSYIDTVEFSDNGQSGEAARAEELSGVASRLGPPMVVVLPLLLVAMVCLCRVCCKVWRRFAEDDDDEGRKGQNAPQPQVIAGSGPLE